MVDLVEARLLTPLGLRFLAPGGARLWAHYGGDPRERDGGYHQGTIWPWLIGPLIERWTEVAALLHTLLVLLISVSAG